MLVQNFHFFLIEQFSISINERETLLMKYGLIGINDQSIEYLNFFSEKLPVQKPF